MKKLFITLMLCLFVGCVSTGKNVTVRTSKGLYEFENATMIQHSEEIWFAERDRTVIFESDQIEEMIIR